jgi:hypothetical protein
LNFVKAAVSVQKFVRAKRFKWQLRRHKSWQKVNYR